jgi:LPS-assembly lipoprotein
MKRLAILTAALLLLPGCGLHPLYAGGSKGVVAQTLAGIEVAPIGGQAGWLMRNALTDRLTVGGTQTPRYRLEVELDDQIIGLGVRSDNSVTRERRTLRARYKLVDAGAGAVLLDATAGSDAGIDVVSSDYATVAAEQTALENLIQAVSEQIVARLSLYASRTAAR